MARKAPTDGVRPWSDPGLKCLLTLSCLLREKGHRRLDAAIKKYVDEENMYVSDQMEAFLVEYSLGDAELAMFERIDPYQDWPDDMFQRLIPFFDGEDEPFLVECWDDLVRLPNVSHVVCQREGAIPSPELVSRLPKLQTVVFSTTEDQGRRALRSIAKFQASGFFVSAVDYTTSWTTLKRVDSGPSKELLSLLAKRFPKEVYRKGKGGFIIRLARASFETGALVAHVELTLFRPEDPLVHRIGGEHPGPSSDLSLLGSKELAGGKAVQLLEARIDELFSLVASERRLPAGLA